MPSKYFGNQLIFKRFKHIQTSPQVKLFKFALKNLPLIEDNMDMLTTIENEILKMAT